MKSDRPYRKALPLPAAREEITRWSGRKFDPEIVKVFLPVADDIWEHIRLEVAGLRVSMGEALSLEAGRGSPPRRGATS